MCGCVWAGIKEEKRNKDNLKDNIYTYVIASSLDLDKAPEYLLSQLC